MVRLGVLGFQGSVEEHIRSLSKLDGVSACVVKTKKLLNEVDGIILPGGESTTIGKLLKEFGLLELLKNRIEDGMPVWGTCAGMILLAKEIVNQDQTYLSVMDIQVRRNAYGSQLDSFITREVVKGVSDKAIPMVFIRAPWIERCGDSVQVLAKVRDHIVAARSNNMIVTSFHPELTSNLEFHRYFVDLVRAN